MIEREPPYYAVIFTSTLSDRTDGYAEMAERMERLAAEEPGFLGMESVRNEGGVGITVSYWQTTEDIARWKGNVEHLAGQELGKRRFYRHYSIRIARVERAYSGPDREIDRQLSTIGNAPEPDSGMK